MSGIDQAELRRRTDAMRDLNDADRRAAIAAAANVIGFERMLGHARQVQLREEYRRSFAPKPRGAA